MISVNLPVKATLSPGTFVLQLVLLHGLHRRRTVAIRRNDIVFHTLRDTLNVTLIYRRVSWRRGYVVASNSSAG